MEDLSLILPCPWRRLGVIFASTYPFPAVMGHILVFILIGGESQETRMGVEGTTIFLRECMRVGSPSPFTRSPRSKGEPNPSGSSAREELAANAMSSGGPVVWLGSLTAGPACLGF